MGLLHKALQEIEWMENANPKERFILQEKAGLLAKLGLWEDWEAVDKKLKATD
jgi:hypothetical protein